MDALSDTTGRFAYGGLDRIIHERARLGIMTSLAAHPKGLFFADLKELCHLTDGNLSRHLDILRQADLLRVTKQEHDKKRPKTRYGLTAHGRARFLAYLGELERVVTDATPAISADAADTAWTGATTESGKL